jgi:hypothetical protein
MSSSMHWSQCMHLRTSPYMHSFSPSPLARIQAFSFRDGRPEKQKRRVLSPSSHGNTREMNAIVILTGYERRDGKRFPRQENGLVSSRVVFRRLRNPLTIGSRVGARREGDTGTAELRTGQVHKRKCPEGGRTFHQKRGETRRWHLCDDDDGSGKPKKDRE